MTIPDAPERSLLGLELALIRHRRGVRRRLGVSDEELAVLLCLAHDGSVPQARLAALTTLSRSGTGALVQRLEQAGLVERRAVADDRRVRLVRLSARGRERLERAYSERDEAVRELFGSSSAEELDAAGRLLGGLAGAADALGEASPDPAAPASTSPIWRRWG